jgi:hypothetical protein
LQNYTVVYTASDHLPPHNGWSGSSNTTYAGCPLQELPTPHIPRSSIAR